MMTREDMLRELELLPIWRLRSPALLGDQVNTDQNKLNNQPSTLTKSTQTQTIHSQRSAAPIHVLLDQERTALEPQQIENKTLNKADETKLNYNVFTSEDKKWAFIFNENMPTHPLEKELFNNILIALKITQMQAAPTQSFSEPKADITLLMGEAVAQSVLKKDAPLESLRGTMHYWCAKPAIVTYQLQDLLSNPANKAKAWDDLCLALYQLNT